MKKTLTLVLLLMLMPTAVNAATEAECQKAQTEYFDVLMKKCAELKRTMTLEQYSRSACPFRYYPFVPTKKTPDMADYRELFIEFGTVNCMVTPHAND